MSWLHYETTLAGHRASVLFDNRFASSSPPDLSELGWLGVHTRLEPGAAYWNPEETDALDTIEADLLRLCEQVSGGHAVYLRRVASYRIREYYIYFRAGLDLTPLAPRLQVLHPGYHVEFEHKADAPWAHYSSWLAESRGV